MLFYLCETSNRNYIYFNIFQILITSVQIVPPDKWQTGQDRCDVCIPQWTLKQDRERGAVVECRNVTWGCRFAPRWCYFWENLVLLKKFDICKSLLKKFDISSGMPENFFRHQAELVLRHQMRVSNYFVNFFYSEDVFAHTVSVTSSSLVFCSLFSHLAYFARW